MAIPPFFRRLVREPTNPLQVESVLRPAPESQTVLPYSSASAPRGGPSIIHHLGYFFLLYVPDSQAASSLTPLPSCVAYLSSPSLVKLDPLLPMLPITNTTNISMTRI